MGVLFVAHLGYINISEAMAKRCQSTSWRPRGEENQGVVCLFSCSLVVLSHIGLRSSSTSSIFISEIGHDQIRQCLGFCRLFFCSLIILSHIELKCSSTSPVFIDGDWSWSKSPGCGSCAMRSISNNLRIEL